ncbi:MAG: hypothetical protein U0575_07575 [Phycisphaerales bacterium]
MAACAAGASLTLFAASSHAQQGGWALNPSKYGDQQGGVATSLPPLSSQLVTLAGGVGTFGGGNPPSVLTVTGLWRLQDLAPGNLLVQGFNHSLVSVVSSNQLGLGDVNSYQVMFAPYFAAFPEADWAWAWYTGGNDPSLGASLGSGVQLPTDLRPNAPCGDQVPFTAVATGSPNIGDGVMGFSFSGVVSAHQICFYAEDGLVGHTWVEFRDSDGNVTSRGKYPVKKAPFADGDIRDDGAHAWTHRICFRVSSSSYNAAAALVNAQIAAPGHYSVTSANCVDFALAVAGAAGIALPATSNLAGISAPSTLDASIAAILQGGGVGDDCGVATANSGGLAGGAPFDADAGLLLQTALDDPAAAAAITDMMLVSSSLGTTTAGTGALVVIGIGGATPSDALIGIDWGDGSEPFAQSISAAHAYAAAGIYQGRVVVVDDAAVHAISFDVHVQPGAGPASIGVTIDDLPPDETPNPGFETDQPVAVIPIGCTTDCNGDGIPDCVQPGACCFGDFDNSLTVDGADLGVLLGAWGQSGAQPADLNHDGLVDGGDLGALLGAWGSCLPPG